MRWLELDSAHEKGEEKERRDSSFPPFLSLPPTLVFFGLLHLSPPLNLQPPCFFSSRERASERRAFSYFFFAHRVRGLRPEPPPPKGKLERSGRSGPSKGSEVLRTPAFFLPPSQPRATSWFRKKSSRYRQAKAAHFVFLLAHRHSPFASFPSPYCHSLVDTRATVASGLKKITWRAETLPTDDPRFVSTTTT